MLNSVRLQVVGTNQYNLMTAWAQGCACLGLRQKPGAPSVPTGLFDEGVPFSLHAGPTTGEA